MKNESKSERKQFEKCVLCDKETVYTTDDNVMKRAYFVDGAGQLCRECYEKVYHKKGADA